MAFDFPANPLPDTVFTDTATGVNYVWDGIAWKRPATVASVKYVEEAPSTGNPYSRQNAGWVPSTMGGGIPEAPLDAKPYSRKDAAWAEIPPPLADAPSNDGVYGRKNAGWEPVQPLGLHSGDTPPTSPTPGMLWFDTTDASLHVWVDDGTSVQWVEVAIDEAPVDGTKYVRQNAAWVPA
jgi:hypothetical protein